LIGRVREAVQVAFERVGATAIIEEAEGDYPSPTLLIDDVELDGYPLESGTLHRPSNTRRGHHRHPRRSRPAQ
jgi:hypothetical protein